jgi:uncharacterized repeat protein (TIGR01451 family)
MVRSAFGRIVTVLALVGLIAATPTSSVLLSPVRDIVVPQASADALPGCLDRISVQDQYTLLKVKDDVFFHRSIHRTDLNDWYSVRDNQPWGAGNQIADIDLTEIPKGLANPTVPVALLSQASNVWIHYNLLDLANGNWQSLNSNKPWGNGNVTNVGIAGHPNDTTLRGVASVGDRAYFFSSVIRDNPYGSFNWGDVSDNKPWGTHAVVDIDVTNENRGRLLADNGTVYVHSNLLSLGAADWVASPRAAQVAGATRLDAEFRPTLVSVGSNPFYNFWPEPIVNAPNWVNIADNKPWGNVNIDDVSSFFWLQEEPWNTPAIVMLTAGAKPYLHWHPENVAPTGAQHDWIDTSDNAPWNEPGAACNPIPPDANLSIVKTAPSGTITRGNVITYSVVVTNAGPSAATNVVVRDQVPAGVTFAAGSSDNACSLQGNEVVCAIGDLAKNATRTLALSFNVPTIDNCADSTLANTATVSGSPNDSVTSNNTSTSTVTLACPPAQSNLSITKTAASQTITRGNLASYTISVSNHGTATATNVIVTDPVPATMAFNAGASDSSCQIANNVVSCAIGQLVNGETEDIIIAFDTTPLNPCVANQVENIATVRSDQSDPTTSNNQSAVTINVQCPQQPADLSITKTGPASVARGDTVVYNITVLNSGPGVANGVVVTDPIPVGGLTFNAGASDSSCQVVNNEVKCSIGTLQNGQPKNFAIAFNVPTVPNCSQGTIQNRATVATTTADPATGNNQSSIVSTTVECSASSSSSSASSISSVSSASSVSSSAMSSTSSISSLASSSASSVSSISSFSTSSLSSTSSISSSSVSSVSSASSTSSALGCVEVRKEALDVNGNPLPVIPQFTFTLDPNTSSSRTLTNNTSGIVRFENVPVGVHTVTEVVPATWQQLLVTPANGVTTVSAGSNCAVVLFRNRQTIGQTAAFQVQKTDSRTTADVGSILPYSITVTNVSGFETTNVSIVDVLPADLVFLNASHNAQYNSSTRTVTWTISSIPANQSVTLTLNAQIRSTATNGTKIRNVAQVNNQFTGEDETTVSRSTSDADIEISISDDPDPVEPGEELTYEIEVCNEGDDDAENLTVLQILPDDVEVTDDDGGEEDDGTITWDNIDIDEDDCVTFEVEVELDDDLDDGDELETVVLVDGDSEEESTEVDDDDDDNDDDDDDDDDDGGLEITKEASASEVFPGGVVEYTLTIENDTGEDLTDIVIEDSLSGGSFSILDDGDAEERSGNSLTWEIDELDDGDTEIIRYRISIDQSAFPGELIRNDVTVESDGFEDDASAQVTVIGQLPQTGFGITNGGSNSSNLRPYGKNTGSTLPIFLWATIAMAGTGLGAGAARKWLIGL